MRAKPFSYMYSSRTTIAHNCAWPLLHDLACEYVQLYVVLITNDELVVVYGVGCLLLNKNKMHPPKAGSADYLCRCIWNIQSSGSNKLIILQPYKISQSTQ
eukprot:COSAG01_NODE_326_length_18790_cov_10.366005_8_plen_101_part_00